MLSMTQKNILQHLGLFVVSKCHRRWNKERSSLRLRQLEEALRCAVNAFGNNHQQGKAFSFWLSWAWGLQDMKLSHVIINTPAACTRWDYWSHSHGPWCLGSTPSNGPAISFHHHEPHTSVHQDSLCLFIWMLNFPEGVYTLKQESPIVASSRNWKENKSRDGKNTMPWWGAGPQHPVCVLWEQGDCISWGGKTGWENDFS